MIYFIQDSGTLAIKIGYTAGDSPEARRKALQTGNPSPLVLLAAAEGDTTDEAALHRRFAEARIGGEWFRPVPELITTIIAAARAPCVLLVAREGGAAALLQCPVEEAPETLIRASIEQRRERLASWLGQLQRDAEVANGTLRRRGLTPVRLGINFD